MKRFLSSLIFIAGFQLNDFSQLAITNNNSAGVLAQDIVGAGVTVSNATLNCGGTASGTFTYTGTNLGIPNGILLTNGRAKDVANPGTYFCNFVNGNNFTDPNVTAISPQATYDACILQFDFVPVCDTLRVTYVFGSDEYPQYINQYNDVFALFLTGPKPLGGNYTQQNVATLPNGTTPVSINTVNGGWPIGTGASNSNYYVDNYTSPNNDIAYNGYTVPVTSAVPVLPCSTYHIKIAVVDAGNGHNDSGVFLKGSAFGCQNAPVVTTSTSEACSNNGTASATVSNYTGTPTYSWSPGGQTTATINNLAPGTYTCVVTFPGLCANYTVTAVVAPPAPLTVPSPTICSGNSTMLTVSGANTYTWTPATGLSSSSGASVTANPTVTTTYTVSGTDGSGCVESATAMVTVKPVPTASVSANGPVCAGQAINLVVSSNGGTSYAWSGPNGYASPVQNPVISNSASANAGVYTVTVANNGCSVTQSVSVTVNNPPTINAASQSICKGKTVQLNASGANTYTWAPATGLSSTSVSNPVASPTATTSYTVSGTDANGCKNSQVVAVTVSSVTASIGANPTSGISPLTVNFNSSSSAGSNNSWNFGNGTTLNGTQSSTQETYQTPGSYTVTMIATNSVGCTDTVSVVILVDINESISVPNVFSPNGDGINDLFFVKNTGYSALEMYIYDRWGLLMWQSSALTAAWDGRHNGKDASDGTYYYIVKAVSDKGSVKNFDGYLLLVR